MTENEDDPVLEAFLDLIDRDMREHPERIRPLSADLIARAEELVGDIKVDLDEDLGRRRLPPLTRRPLRYGALLESRGSGR